MTDSDFTALLAALGASPDNNTLRALVVRAALDRDDNDQLVQLLDGHGPDLFEDPGDLARISDAFVAQSQAQRALEFCVGDVAAVAVSRARALLALGRREEARAAYRSAVRQNSTLEDTDLAIELGANISEHETDDGRKLRVIANDDTDDTELDRLLHPNQEQVTFRDVGGLADIKKQIERKIIAPFQKPALFQRFKKRVGGGILLYGPPGCGKTLLARATAGQCDASFFNITISDVLDMYIGESERKLRALFDKARAATPSVVFFDELEALAGKRRFSREGTSSKLVSQFLSEMDGFSQANTGVLILGATNVPWAVDPAFRRPGRFDRVLFVPPPDRDARAAILRLLLADRPIDDGIPYEQLAKKTRGFSGADLAGLVETATDYAIEASLDAGSEVPIRGADLIASLDEVKPTTLEWLTTARNHARYANEGGQYDEVLAFLAKFGK